MRVVAFTKTSAIGPSSRYRYLQYRERLRESGIELEVRPLFGSAWFALLAVRPRALGAILKLFYVPIRFLHRAAQLAALGRVPLVVVEHQLFPYLPAWFERRLAKKGVRFTVEFDDAIYLTFRHRAKLAELCRIATAVVVGNRFLADFARAAGAEPSIVPTTIALERYGPVRRSERESRPFTIGWIGLPYNFAALQTLAAPLRTLAGERAIVLRVVSSGAPELEGVPVERVEWSEAGEVEAIRGFDVGVMPLTDDEWSRGKCGLKILQCFAAGVPVVASPVGVNAEIVEEGASGFLARTADEWLAALRRLASDPALRDRLGAAGRRRVEQEFSADAWAPRLAAVWKRAAGAAT